jgi:uncharacterized Zn finger protein
MHLTDSLIATLIDERYRERGKHYFQQGMVELTKISATQVKAKCAGTRVYKTTLKLDNGTLSGQCSCPAFTDFGPCKHMAAVAYAVMASKKAGYAPSEAYKWRKEEYKHLENQLMKKSKNELIMLIMQILDDDPNLKWMFEGE